MNLSSKTYLLWDWPIRLFHWLLVVNVVALFVSIKTGNIEWHGRLGMMAIGLVTFRIVLGFWGGEVARFASFVKSPKAIIEYLRLQKTGGHWAGVGHNPIGGYSVLALLGVVLLQALTGLLSNDDIAFSGPWAALVSKEVSDIATRIHKIGEKVIMALVLLHIAAMVFYAVAKKDNLVRPMILGKKPLLEGQTIIPPKPTPTGIAILALFVALGTMLVVRFAAEWLK